MTRRLTPLPREGRNSDIARLMTQRAALVAEHKSTAVIDRRLKLARAWELRREAKQGRVA